MAASSSAASLLLCSMVTMPFHADQPSRAPAEDFGLARGWRDGRDRLLGFQVRRFRSASGHLNVARVRSWVLTASTHLGLRSAGIV
jgi:hypothetical protein